ISGGKTTTGASANADASVFARAGYSYLGRYIVQGTWRHDGSSRFGQKNKWGDFFSGSAAWRFSDESFMDWTRGVLTDGKLRFSVGQAGNDRIGDYQSFTVLNFGLQYYNGLYTAAENSTLGNSTIKWETTTTTDYGIDLSFLRGRLTFAADYYRKFTSNLLYNKELPKETGKSQVTVNLGDIVNTGLEFTVGGTPVATKNFTWDLTGNISFQRGYIKSLANHTSFISGNKWLIREGGKIGDFFLWDNLGVYQYDASNAYDVNGVRLEPVNVTAAGTTSDYLLNGEKYTGTVYSKSRNGIKLQGGDTEWRDVNNDGIIDDKDKVIAGNGVPNYYFGITNNIRFKSFSFSFLVNGQIGNDIYNSVANAQNTFSS
ncbi:MAG TPA: TonB-dependent receptor, partial [Chitinophagaceae bacterium]|nr:TonB-dependent receptor [Chitinophagaceae bacterium]